MVAMLSLGFTVVIPVLSWWIEGQVLRRPAGPSDALIPKASVR